MTIPLHRPHRTGRQIALRNEVDYATCLGLLRDARKQGLTAPVLLMGTLRAGSGVDIFLK